MHSSQRYNLAVVAIHWFMALGIGVAFAAGLYMVSIPGITPDKLRLYNWHKWLGVTLFALVCLRLLVRWASFTPAYPAHWHRRTVLAAKLGHVALYVLMLGVPVWGYLFSLASGFPVVWFGWLELPVFLEKNDEAKALFKCLHEWSAIGLMGLVGGHVLMALKHHFIDRDFVLGRMVPGASKKNKKG